jgi:glycosyltransferase involved in cell wall biosynthesis
VSTTTPVVSVCLPVYNGERHLRDAIESVRKQSLESWELLLCDNASTDRTSAYCQEAAASDPRIHYHPAATNRGLAWNFNRAFRLATGRYLLWLGHDDVLGRDYLLRCVEALETRPDAVLCFARNEFIDGQSDHLASADLERAADAPQVEERLMRVLFDHRCEPICGVMRVDVLRHTRLHLPYADSDRVLLAELALRGRFVQLPEPLFHRRVHDQQVTSRFTDRWQRSLIFDPAQAGKMSCPVLREARDLCSAIRRAPLRRGERHRCYKCLYWWLRAHHQILLDDVHRAFAWAVGRRPMATVLPS